MFTIKLTSGFTFDVEVIIPNRFGFSFIAPDSWTLPEIMQMIVEGDFHKVERTAEGNLISVETSRVGAVSRC